ncbi:MAG: ParB N-terminal domain-containing protein [Candidatus Aenigmarchaeota archaeon]|nr:ParB N-terminal domain-containing protein [Candidatus Aenigmarchaeota archaeon]
MNQQKSNYYLRPIPVNKLVFEPSGMKEMSDEEFEMLKNAISKVGILTPLQVTYDPEKDKYIILDGRHRYKAALELGLTEVPCVVEISEETDVLVSHIYDAELIRKSYTKEEVQKYLQEKEKQLKIATERIISSIASDAIPKEIIEKIAQSNNINSIKKMQKLISYIDKYQKEKIDELQKLVEEHQRRLSEKEQRERELLDRLKKTQETIEKIKEQFEQKVQEQAQERLNKEVERLQLINKELSEKELHELEEKIRKQVTESLKGQFELEKEQLEEELKETETKLVELSRKYNKEKEELKKKDDEIRALSEIIKKLETENKNLKHLQAQHHEKLKKVSNYSSIEKKTDQIITDLNILRSLIISYSGEGFEDLEISDLKGRFRKLKEITEIIESEIEQIKPYTEFSKN